MITLIMALRDLGRIRTWIQRSIRQHTNEKQGLLDLVGRQGSVHNTACVIGDCSHWCFREMTGFNRDVDPTNAILISTIPLFVHRT